MLTFIPPELFITAVSHDLSPQAKQTFQVVALLATILVVGIHYKSDVPESMSISDATWNEIAQEYVFGGVARVAVPLFAFAAGFFYSRSFDGTLKCYRKKLGQRLRSVAIPYFIVASLAMFAWLMNHRLQGDPSELSVTGFFAKWLLHPPAEQLWFLRDLMVLVSIAPLFRWIDQSAIRKTLTIGFLSAAWANNFQVFPIVAGWRLLQMETLLFCAVGMSAALNPESINRACSVRPRWIVLLLACWLSLVAARVLLRPDFDAWYVHDYGVVDLMVHQASILIGCMALFMLASRMRFEWLIRISGASFFVFLIHEFPLRAFIDKLMPSLMDVRLSCWIVVPVVVSGCYTLAWVANRYFPKATALLTGGRTPDRASKIASNDNQISVASPKTHSTAI